MLQILVSARVYSISLPSSFIVFSAAATTIPTTLTAAKQQQNSQWKKQYKVAKLEYNKEANKTGSS